MDEMLRLATDLPDPHVRLAPALLEVIEEDPLQSPRTLLVTEAVRARLVQRVQNLPEHVELDLLARRIPDAHGRGALVAREPRQLELGQAPLARNAVHDLDVGGIAGDGAQEPRAPGARFLFVVSVEEREQRQR